MTLLASVGWSFARAALLACLAWPCCRVLVDWIDSVDGTRRRGRMLAVLVPFLFPELLVGYAYTPVVAGLPVRAELWCAVLMGLRLIPVGVVALWLTPSSAVSQSALHCRALCQRDWRDRVAWIWLWLQGPFRQGLPAGLLMALVAFQQFELAALLTATSWADWLFVQQVAGLPFDAALRASWLPCSVQVALLLLAATAVPPRRGDVSEAVQSAVRTRIHGPHSGPYGSRPIGVAIWGGLAVIWLLIVVIPLMRLLPELPTGLVQLATQTFRVRGLLRELVGGLAIAVLAALSAWVLSATLLPSGATTMPAARRLRLFTYVLAVGLLPGLLGSLVLSLGLIAVFQKTAFAALYGTPMVWWLGLTIFLLPRAWLMQLWLSQAPSSGVFLAETLCTSQNARQRAAGRRLWLRFVAEPRWLAGVVLVWWGYLDLTTAYLLAPVSMSSGVVRLYNFMHFGRSAALSAEAAVLLIGPWIMTAVLWGLWRGLQAR